MVEYRDARNIRKIYSRVENRWVIAGYSSLLSSKEEDRLVNLARKGAKGWVPRTDAEVNRLKANGVIY